jgi:hypothetical protein
MEDTEIWKPVKGFEKGYEISVTGELRSISRRIAYSNGYGRLILAKEIKPRQNNRGYMTLRLSKDRRAYTKCVHRLKAEAFIPNPFNKRYINHKNGNKLDNRLENLEWVTHAQNIRHAYDYGLCKTVSMEKLVVDKCTGRKFLSAKQASEYYHIPYSTCKNYLNGNRQNRTCLEYAA